MDGKLHVTFKINRATDVYASDFVDFVSAILDAGRLCSEMMGEEFDKKGLTIKSSINSPGPVEFIAGSISFLIALAAIALFLNGAKTKLKFDFTLAKGEFDIESEGLLEKLARLRQKQNALQNIERLEQIENKLIEAQNQLQISGKRN